MVENFKGDENGNVGKWRSEKKNNLG